MCYYRGTISWEAVIKEMESVVELEWVLIADRKAGEESNIPGGTE